ncbi:MAG: hypothetical protein HXY30_08115 [Pseudorhodoplanes sp.]|nr:hypothetical protein [Pseudorhodoplanes sp.]
MALEAHTRTGLDESWRTSRTGPILLSATILAMFIVVTFVFRLMPWHWGDARRRSIFGEARASTDRLMPFLYMG